MYPLKVGFEKLCQACVAFFFLIVSMVSCLKNAIISAYMLLVQEVYLKLSWAHWRSGLKDSGQDTLDSFIHNDLYFCMGKQLFKWKHSEHQRRENTFSMLRFLKAASLFVFFSENGSLICSALFDSCLVSLHNKLIFIKPLIFLCFHQTHAIFPT